MAQGASHIRYRKELQPTHGLEDFDERYLVESLDQLQTAIAELGSFNVYPKEIDAIPGVAESAVVGIPHADFGEGLTAAVVRTPGSAVDERAMVFVEALPRNTMGKAQKTLLHEHFVDLYMAKAG